MPNERRDPLFTDEERERLWRLPQELRAATINLRSLRRAADVATRAAEHASKRAREQGEVVFQLRQKHELCLHCGGPRPESGRTRCFECLPDFGA